MALVPETSRPIGALPRRRCSRWQATYSRSLRLFRLAGWNSDRGHSRRDRSPAEITTADDLSNSGSDNGASACNHTATGLLNSVPYVGSGPLGQGTLPLDCL